MYVPRRRLFLAALGSSAAASLLMSGDADYKQVKMHHKEKPVWMKVLPISLCVVLLLGIYNSFTIIPAGYVGVVDLFGSVSHTTLSSGLNLVNPLAKVVTISLQTQLLEFETDVPSNEGLTVGLDVSVLFHVETQNTRNLYITVGAKYVQVLVAPEVKSSIRDLTGQVSAKALYSEGREGLSKGLHAELNNRLQPRGITVEHVMLRGVKLPDQLQRAIQLKLESEQESQRMEFVLLKEKQEAERKRIEAQGISDFQRIVSQGISTQLLEWKGIEATEKLAHSKNAKIVMFGNPANGLPTILGGLESTVGRQRNPEGDDEPAQPNPAAALTTVGTKGRQGAKGDLQSGRTVGASSSTNRKLLAEDDA